jgi:hypothetical protein
MGLEPVASIGQCKVHAISKSMTVD